VVVAPGDDLELIEQLLARQPVEAMERLAHHFTPSALRRLRLAERDAKIRTLAVGQPGSGRKIARDVHKELRVSDAEVDATELVRFVAVPVLTIYLKYAAARMRYIPSANAFALLVTAYCADAGSDSPSDPAFRARAIFPLSRPRAPHRSNVPRTALPW
jgi:hypothetical protein